MPLFLSIYDLIRLFAGELHRVSVYLLGFHGKHLLLLQSPYDRGRDVQLLCHQFILQHRIVQESCHEARPCLLVLPQIIVELPLPCLPVEQEPQPLLYPGILFLLDGEDCLQCLDHRAPVVFLHPRGKGDQFRLDLHPGPGDFQDLLHFREVIITRLRKPGHISFDPPVAPAEGHDHFHPRLQLIHHTLRHAVLKDLIQFFMLYVYDHIRKHSVFILLSVPPGPPRSVPAHPWDTSRL